MNNHYSSTQVPFYSNKTQCMGYLHQPIDVDDKRPAILMANGCGTEWQFGTRGFIKRFTETGFAVFTFDYRYFGQSDGEPRQLIDIHHQQQDLEAAYETLLKLPQINTEKIAVWGSSLGGGHAIGLAAKSPQIKALVAQVPHCCSDAAGKSVDGAKKIKAIAHILWDKFAEIFGTVHYVPIVEEPKSFAMMNYVGWHQEYLAITGERNRWRNATPARSLIKSAPYRPTEVANEVDCPALIIYGRNDVGVPAHSVEEAAAKMKRAESHIYEGDHFEVYSGPTHDDIVQRQCTFLIEQLEP